MYSSLIVNTFERSDIEKDIIISDGRKKVILNTVFYLKTVFMKNTFFLLK